MAGRYPAARDERLELDLSWRVFGKLALAVLLAWGLWLVRGIGLTLLLALFLAVTLQPLVAWLQRRRLSHGTSLAVTALVVLVVLALVSSFVVSPLATQVPALARNAGRISDTVQGRLEGWPVLQRGVQQMVSGARSIDFRSVLSHGWMAGQAIFGGVTWLVLLLVFCFYLLADGRRLYAWFLSYAPREQRPRVAATVEPVTQVIRAYVRGQLLTSTICGVFTFIVLSVLHVPAALPLAVLAAVLDVIPMLGVIIALTPAFLLALTRSTTVALAVLVLYVAYHQIESYFISPRVYGRYLRLSALATLLATLIGGTLAGIPGVLVALPLVAAYPTVERVWFARSLPQETVEEHRAMDDPDEAQSQQAIDQVVRGESPARH